MLAKSGSGAGLATRAAGVPRVESVVSVGTPVRVVTTELAPVGARLGAPDAAAVMGARATMYSSGRGGQYPNKRKVPRLRSVIIILRNSGKLTPSWPTILRQCSRHSKTSTWIARTMHAKYMFAMLGFRATC